MFLLLVNSNISSLTLFIARSSPQSSWTLSSSEGGFCSLSVISKALISILLKALASYYGLKKNGLETLRSKDVMFDSPVH